jgi:YegS/Rv2252/BmrU family lipid kinase
MNFYTAVVFANDKFSGNHTTANNYIALADVHGKPALDWVITALRGSSLIKNIIVVGPEFIDELLCFRFIYKRFPPASIKVRETIAHMSDAPISEDPDINNHGLFFIHCGCVYLTTKAIEQMIYLFEKQAADIAFPVVSDYQSYSKLPLQIQLHHEQKMAVSLKAGFARSKKYITPYLHQYAMYGITHSSEITIFASTIADASKKLPAKNGTAIGLFPVKNSSVVRCLESMDDCRQAEAAIPNPWEHRFSNAKILLNPHAGAGKPLPRILVQIIGMQQRTTDRSLSPDEISKKILSYISTFKIDAEIITLKKNMSIVDQTHRCIQDSADLVIAAGGDGTINSVINGLANTGVPLGVIPLGTANVLAIELSIPPEIRSACQLIAQGELKRIDLGKLNNKYFSCMAGIGFDAYVARQVESNSKLKRKIGGMAFLLTAIIDIFKYRFHSIKLILDNQTIARSGYLVLVGNGKRYGGSLVLSPYASMNDGLLDVVIFKSKNIFSILNYLQGLLKGTLPDIDTIEYLQGKKITVLPKGHHHVHMDGEYFGHTPVNIEIAPGALKVIC